MINKADLPFVIARLRRAADELEQAGLTAWETRDGWAAGAGTANYDPEAGGNRWEADEDDDTVWPVPNDPTGDKALRPDDVDMSLTRYRRHLGDLLRAADHVIEDVTTATPHRPDRIGDADRLATQVGAEGWCSSCYRNAGKLVPQAMHSNGQVKHRGLCRWCADFEREYGRKPPLSLLQQRHAGRSITIGAIEKALGYARKRAS